MRNLKRGDADQPGTSVFEVGVRRPVGGDPAGYGISRLALFGSRLGSDFRPDSDIDILVRFQPEARIGMITFSKMQRELTEMFGREVDLVTETSLKPPIRDEVLSGSQELYAT